MIDPRRADPRLDPRPPGAGGARVDRLPDGRRGARDRGVLQGRPAGAQGRRRRGVQQVAHAVPGGSAGLAAFLPRTSAGFDRDPIALALAGVATGLWSETDVRENWREAARYEPAMSSDERHSLMAAWTRALERSKDWAEAE